MRRLAVAALAVGLAALVWTFLPWDLDPGAYGAASIPAGAPPVPAVAVELSIVRTASIATIDAFAYRGGRPWRQRTMAVSAVLVRHPRATLLFDTGLGSAAGAQFAGNPFWARKLLGYEMASTAAEQLRSAGVDPASVSMIVLSHIHWDHASGILDFPGAEVLTTREEHAFGLSAGRPAVIREQFDAPSVRWRFVTLEGPPYEGFATSLDLFADGSVVLVPLPGHTPGSLGMFVNLASGRRFLFTGDLTWAREGIERPAERPLLSRLLVDRDPAMARKAIVSVHQLCKRRPELVVVPAHDAAAQARVATFPELDR
ncbi:MAG: MBL fold metallo-hydrolase [Acidobacteriota bacterium]